jgi:lipopolysaccharide transport protein LptA
MQKLVFPHHRLASLPLRSADRLLLAFHCFLLLSLMPTNARAEETARTRIESDLLRMQGSPSQNLFFFEGSVIVRGKDLVMTCDRMEVTSSRMGDAEATVGGFGAVEGILATGNVVIRQAERTAYAEKAEVEPEKGIVTLSGNPRIVDTHAEITGWKIILDRSSKTARVLPSPDALTENPQTGLTEADPKRQRSTVILGGEAIPQLNFDNRPQIPPEQPTEKSPPAEESPPPAPKE